MPGWSAGGGGGASGSLVAPADSRPGVSWRTVCLVSLTVATLATVAITTLSIIVFVLADISAPGSAANATNAAAEDCSATAEGFLAAVGGIRPAAYAECTTSLGLASRLSPRIDLFRLREVAIAYAHNEVDTALRSVRLSQLALLSNGMLGPADFAALALDPLRIVDASVSVTAGVPLAEPTAINALSSIDMALSIDGGSTATAACVVPTLPLSAYTSGWVLAELSVGVCPFACVTSRAMINFTAMASAVGNVDLKLSATKVAMAPIGSSTYERRIRFEALSSNVSVSVASQSVAIEQPNFVVSGDNSWADSLVSAALNTLVHSPVVKDAVATAADAALETALADAMPTVLGYLNTSLAATTVALPFTAAACGLLHCTGLISPFISRVQSTMTSLVVLDAIALALWFLAAVGIAVAAVRRRRRAALGKLLAPATSDATKVSVEMVKPP